MTSHSNNTEDGGNNAPRPLDALIDEFGPTIEQILSVIRVPNDIRDDCRQAALMGLIKAAQRQENTKYFKSYAIRCMKNEVLIEIAKLKGPGNGLFSLDAITFLLLSKYKKALKSGDFEDLNISDGREDVFNRMLRIKRYSYMETPNDE